MGNTAYSAGKKIGAIANESPVLSALVIISLAAFALKSCMPAARRTPETTVVTSSAPIDRTKECQAKMPEMLATYHQRTKESRHWDAATSLRSCAAVLNDAELKALVQQAELLDLVKTATNKAAPTSHRLDAIQRVSDMDPAKAKELEPVRAQLDKLMALQEAKARKAIAAEKRSKGVSLGMTKEDVLASSWGKPSKINTSVYSFGTHEQWVYHGGNYLYFKDGILDSLQTGE